MTRYLLDTTALIDFSKNREPARSRILHLIGTADELGVSPTDSLIAAVAKEQQAVLITNNIKDYPMEEIDLLPLHS